VTGRVRLRQIADRMRHRLSFVPTLYVFGAVALVQIFLWIDRQLATESLPAWLETSVDGARSVFTAIAGSLITSTTLLLSMMLVAVQLASSQFSPRTLRNWLGDRTVQHAVGFVLGTTVFCLLALRSTRGLDEDSDPIIPHLTVIAAVALGVLSLVAVVRTVDHIARSLQVGSVIERIASDTIGVVDAVFGSVPTSIDVGPPSGAVRPDGSIDVPIGSEAVETPSAGWVQQIDDSRLIASLPEDSTGYVTAPVGSFVAEHRPIVWIAPAPRHDGSRRSSVMGAIAIGDSRTMQQDVEFGLIQLTDIAVRALSPGVNDPGTASDVLVQLGNVMTSLWRHPALPTTTRTGTRTLVRMRPTHAALLDRAFSPIVHYGNSDPQVVATLRDVLGHLRAEVERRELPGPVEPIDEMIRSLD
jgi:uncharacterized membrane protein